MTELVVKVAVPPDAEATDAVARMSATLKDRPIEWQV